MTTKKKKQPSPFYMQMMEKEKVFRTRIYLKRYRTRPVFMMQPQELRVLYWLVLSTIGYKRKFTCEETARAKFAQLIEFEKHQTRMTLE